MAESPSTVSYVRVSYSLIWSFLTPTPCVSSGVPEDGAFVSSSGVRTPRRPSPVLSGLQDPISRLFLRNPDPSSTVPGLARSQRPYISSLPSGVGPVGGRPRPWVVSKILSWTTQPTVLRLASKGVHTRSAPDGTCNQGSRDPVRNRRRRKGRTVCVKSPKSKRRGVFF